MNVFVLSTGRCGSMTFAHACGHMTNFSSAHESRTALIGPQRLDYPANHIESDNRLSWLLGRLDARYGPAAFYVHLQRNRDQVARSYARRLAPGMIIPAYANAIHFGHTLDIETSAFDIARDYVDTVTANIAAFLKDKPRQMAIHLESATTDFRRFWELIGAEGNLSAALAEFSTPHNASPR